MRCAYIGHEIDTESLSYMMAQNRREGYDFCLLYLNSNITVDTYRDRSHKLTRTMVRVCGQLVGSSGCCRTCKDSSGTFN